MPKKKPTTLTIEEAFSEINTIIETMESNEDSLEKSLEHFERGVQLIKHCQKTLKAAEQKVQKLVEKNGKSLLEDFESEDDDYDDE